MQLSSKSKWLLFAAVATIGLSLDLLTKFFAVKSLTVGNAFSLIGNVVQFYLVYNKGALFGINPRSVIPGFPVNAFFYIFSVIAVVLLIVYYRNLKKGSWLIYIGISLIMPGALGNFIDRLLYPSRGVVDFIKVDLGFAPFNPWPIFNLADAYITVGVILIVLELMREELSRKAEKMPGPAAGDPKNSSEFIKGN